MSSRKVKKGKKFRHKQNNSMKFKKKGIPTEYSTMLDGFLDHVTAENIIYAKKNQYGAPKISNRNVKHLDGLGSN
jgi:hypothetical protein